MLRPALVFLLATAMLPSMVDARKCRVNLDPLLTVESNRDFIPRSIRLPPPPFRVVEMLTVSKGGAASVMRTDTPLCCDLPAERLFASGIARKADLLALRETLNATGAATLSDCVVENDLAGPTGVRIVGAVEVTWYGGPGQRNRFKVVHADPGESDLPLCGAEVEQLLSQVDRFKAALAQDKGNLVCSP